MKFSFEKIPTEEKVPEPELSQEKFDEQILQEAQKLDVNIAELKSEIDKYGGPEKFKEKYETKINEYNNAAGEQIGTLEQQSKDANIEAKTSTAIGSIMTALSAGIAYLPGMNAEGEVFDASPIENFRQAWESGIKDMPEWLHHGFMVGAAAMAFVTLVTGGFFFKQAIEEKIESRKLKHQKKVDELKFKMTGTEIN